MAMGGESVSHASLRGLFFFFFDQHLAAFSLQLTPSASPPSLVLRLLGASWGSVCAGSGRRSQL